MRFKSIPARLGVALCVGACLLLLGCGGFGEEDRLGVSMPAPVVPAPSAIATTAPLIVPTPQPSAPTDWPTTGPSPLPSVVPSPSPETATTPPATDATPTQATAPTSEPAPVPTQELAIAGTEAAAAAGEANVEPTVVATAQPVADKTDIEIETDVVATSTPTSSPVESTPVEPTSGESPPAVTNSSGAPLECFDQDVQIYRAFVERVDALTFDGGRVFCRGAGTNGVAAPRSYRHSSGLIVQRNADSIFNEDGTGYIPYSGSLHFCIDGQPASAAFSANTVPSLLIVIEGEAQNQLGQGAAAPSGFTTAGTRC